MPAPLRGDLRALIVIASPTYTRGSTLDPINVADLERRALAALGDFTPRVLARPNAMPTIDNLEATLAEHQPDLVYIACHGVEEEGETFLLLEQPSGEHFPLRGRRLAEIMGDLSYRPRLVVLAVCHSSGSGAADRELMKLGPRLVRAGVPAVIAMRGAVSFQAAEIFVDSLLKELSRHGQIDLAMATARNSLDNASQHRWMPVLTMRLRDGALWVPRIAASIPPTRQEPGYMMRGRLYNDGPTSRGSIFPEQPRNGEHGREGGMMQPRDLDIHRRGEVARRAQPSGQALESGEQILDYVRSVLDEALFQSEGPSRETIDRIVQMLGVAAEQAERAEDPSRQQHTVAFEHARLCYLCGQHEEAEKLLLQVELFAIKAGAMALINDLREYRRCIEVRRALDGLRKQGEPREQQAKEAVRRLQRVLEQHRSPAASLLMEIISELAITTEEQVNAAALSLRLGVDSPPE